MSDKLWEVYRPLAFKDTWSIVPMLLRPKSKGHIRLRNSNPYEKPIITANYFTHPNDLEVLVEGLKIALALAETHSFKKYGTKFWDKKPIPGITIFLHSIAHRVGIQTSSGLRKVI